MIFKAKTQMKNYNNLNFIVYIFYDNQIYSLHVEFHCVAYKYNIYGFWIDNK